MKILLAYATYSSGTETAASLVKNLLENLQHTITVKRIIETQPTEFSQYDLIIFASPSWLVDGKDGMPHLHFLHFMQEYRDVSFNNRKFAIFGLGDITYARFCGAVEKLQRFVEEHQGEFIHEPLRIDSYYFNQEENNKALQKWIHDLHNKLH